MLPHTFMMGVRQTAHLLPQERHIYYISFLWNSVFLLQLAGTYAPACNITSLRDFFSAKVLVIITTLHPSLKNYSGNEQASTLALKNHLHKPAFYTVTHNS